MFTNIHHIAFVVEDVEASMERFERTFEMELVSRDQMTGTYEMDVALYYAGDNIVELIEPTTEQGWSYELLQENGEGWFHIAFEVDDIRARMADLRERGIRFKQDEPQEGYDWEVATMDERDTIVPMQLVEDD